MTATVPLDHFDRGKPFYPIVMGYLVQLAGFVQLAIRGLRTDPKYRDVFEEGGLEVKLKHDHADLQDQIAKLTGPLQLKSEAAAAHISVPIDLLATDIATNAAYLASFLMRSAGSALILAHEVACKNQPWNDNGPLLEFLRHCRNAAAHGGNFFLRKGEPRRPSAWRGYSIDRDLDGTPMFKNASGVGLLSPGDTIRLLWDIEQDYPRMSCAA